MLLTCAAPAPDVGMVQGLLGSVDCNVRGLSEAGYGALASANSPMTAVLTLMLTIYIAVIGYRLLIGRTPLRVGDITLSALKIGAILALATSWPTYQQVVFETLFQGPEQLAAAMMGAIQPTGGATQGDVFANLQAAYDELQRSAAYMTQHSLSTASPLQGGAAGGALALNASALLILLTSLGAVLAAKIVLGLLLGLGPVFVALFLFDATRGLFEGWLRAAIAFATAPLMAILGLVVQLTLIAPELARLVDMRAQGAVDLAPASAIFLLTLISTGGSLALAIAVGMVATGLRLPQLAPASRSLAPIAANQNGASSDLRIASPAPTEPRAVAIAAAAAAMERRETRLTLSEAATPRRISSGASRSDTTVATPAFAPLGQAYRRAAQPRQAASSLRRDR